MLNKVPEITVFFWVIKVSCTTVGETAADFLNVNLGFGLTGVSVVTGLVLAVLLTFQSRATRYIAGLYWTTVAVVSVFGTLVTDNLTDNIGVPLQLSAAVFAVILAGVFALWYSSERTLSMHSIVTTRRELFYWLAVLVTFALGTATGDLMSEALSLGFAVSALIVAGIIAIFAAAWRLGMNAVLAFWAVYILTRPLGASLGDLLAQSKDLGGLGLGTTATSAVFLLAILGTVVYLTAVKPDISNSKSTTPVLTAPSRNGLAQTAAVVVAVLLIGGGGYAWRKADLASSTTSSADLGSPNAKLGDLSQFRVIAEDTLTMVSAGNQSGATNRVSDLELTWDQAQGRLQARDKDAWTRVDDRIDTVLTTERAKKPDAAKEKQALTELLQELSPT